MEGVPGSPESRPPLPYITIPPVVQALSWLPPTVLGVWERPYLLRSRQRSHRDVRAPPVQGRCRLKFQKAASGP